MVRSLGLCLLVVVPIWYLAQPPDEAEQRVRVVDQAPVISAWQSSADSAPVPGRVPEQWQATVSQSLPQPPGLRLGWVTAPDRYVEFAATAGPSRPFVTEFTGADSAEGSVEVDGVAWQRHVDDDGSISLVRTDGAVTVVVGTRRSTATEDELRELAQSVQP